MPIYLVIRENGSLAIAFAICITATIILKKNWWDKLEESYGTTPETKKEPIIAEKKSALIGDK